MCAFRQKLAIVSCLGLFTATAATAEQTSREWQSCNNADNDTRIAACTGILDKGGRESNKMRANAYANRGIAFGNKGQHDRAVQDFDEALRLDPQNAVMYNNNRGWAFTNKGDVDRGIRDFDEAIRRDPKLAIGFNSRGSSYNIKGDYDRAIQDLDEATPPQSKICEWATSTAPSEISTRRSAPIRNLLLPMATVATPIGRRATRSERSPISTRRYG
jgi:tetratricopeptide (TPR) repeat protein